MGTTGPTQDCSWGDILPSVVLGSLLGSIFGRTRTIWSTLASQGWDQTQTADAFNPKIVASTLFDFRTRCSTCRSDLTPLSRAAGKPQSLHRSRSQTNRSSVGGTNATRLLGCGWSSRGRGSTERYSARGKTVLHKQALSELRHSSLSTRVRNQPFQCLKCLRPVKTMHSPSSSQAAITSSSRLEPPG